MKASRTAGGGGSSSGCSSSTNNGNDASIDNSTEFIEIVKKYDIVYNTHHPDYKNTEVKLRAWAQLGEEIGLSVEAAKRKWKNLRDSYTKYLRSFRTGTKTSKKYQYWAHAEHMEFLKPYQGPGRSTTIKSEEHSILFENEESDLGYQMLAKATSPEDDGKISTTTTNLAMPTITTSASSLPIVQILPIPALPKVQLPPLHSPATPMPTTDDPPQQVPLPLVVNDRKALQASNNTVGPVGCLIIEPQLYASAAESFKNAISAVSSAVTTATSIAATKSNPPLITKIRRVQPSQQQQAPISYATAPAQATPATTSRSRKVTAASSTSSSSSSAAAAVAPTVAVSPSSLAKDLDITSLLQANRDLDSTCLFFMSLAKTVRSMPTKYQSLVKMRCMRIVSDIELEVENFTECNGAPPSVDNNYYTKLSTVSDTMSQRAQSNGRNKRCNANGSPSTIGSATGQQQQQSSANHSNENTEHFLYVMSPSRVEGMIDISSEEETEGSAVANGN